MPSIRDHSERVYRIAHQSSAAVTSPVAASWRRCMTLHGLAPEDARSPWRLSEIEFRQARESSGALIAEAAGELDRLFATVGKAGCCLLLTDGKGVALERRGAGGDDADFRGIGLWSGTVWSEASVGTNGIGTAIADERPVLIQRDQHFLSRNIGLSCATAPIRDESGKLAAAIDISTCRDDASEATLSILSQAVRDAAARIEANLFRRAFVGARIVLVPVDRAGPALLAVDRDDLVLGATRAAGCGSGSTTSVSPPASRLPTCFRKTSRARAANCRTRNVRRCAARSPGRRATYPWRPISSASAARPSTAR